MKYLTDIPMATMALYAAYTDLERMEIDNWLCLAVAVYSIAVHSMNISLLFKNLIWAVCYFAVFFAIYTLFDDSIGGGDIKLLSAMAIYYGANILPLTLIANVLALIYVLASGMLKKKGIKGAVKFGPFIFLATLIMMLGK